VQQHNASLLFLFFKKVNAAISAFTIGYRYGRTAATRGIVSAIPWPLCRLQSSSSELAAV